MATRPITVAVVSDVPLVAAGVRSLLAALGDRVEVVELGERAVCDVALFDPTGRPDEDERRLTGLVADPRCRTVAVYSVGWSDRAMRDALRLGVDSFLPKTMPPADLAAALLDVAAGRPIDAAKRAGRTRRAASWLGRGDGLTERESQVLVLCAEGLSNQEIADALYINVETVKSHLKHAYSRLGVRNRAQAAAYVHRCAPPLPASALAGRAEMPDASDGAAPPAVHRHELPPVDVEQLAERAALLDLGPERRARLAPYAEAVANGADAYVDRLIAHWSQHPATQPFVADAAAAVRLAGAQRRYVADLFGGEFGAEHAASMLAAGVAHHRLRLPSQWFLASYAHVICEHVPLLAVDGVPDVDAITVLVASTLFDAALVLDAYELAVTSELSATVTASPVEGGAPAATEGPPAAPRRRRPVTEIPQHLDEATSRCAFLGIDDDTTAILRRSGPIVASSIPTVLERFYALLTGHDELQRFVPGDTAQRLRSEVGRFWTELAGARFDRTHAASRQRVGVIHEQIGLTPQHYVAGLAVQLDGLIRALAAASADPVGAIDALVRAAFFDMSFVIDAYLDARVAALRASGEYASQIMAGLADGVAVVDARDRIEFANDPFLDLVGVEPAVLHRMPADAAVPIPGLGDLLDTARASVMGRVTTVHTVGARTLRVTALRLDASAGRRGPMVALVVDDISDALLASDQFVREGHRLDHVLDTVEAFVWEADADSLLLLAVSRSAERLTGVRDVDLLGLARFTDLVHTDDVRSVLVACSDLRPGERADIVHRVVRADGSLRSVRSSVAAALARPGETTISGVTIEVPAPTIEPC